MKKICENRKARFNYTLLNKYEAGIVLTGAEVKSIRNGAVNINDAYCQNKNGELFLVNAHISPYKFGSYNNQEPLRDRKLLLHKKEIKKLIIKITEKGLTIVPLKIYFNEKNIVKIELAVAKGKKLYDKRETIKRREANIHVDRYKKNYNVKFKMSS